MIKEQIKSSKYPDLPLYISEWSSQNPAFIADTIKNCIGLAEVLSYWTFEHVFASIALLLWNLVLDPKQKSSMGDPMVQNEAQFVTQGATREFKLQLDGGRK